jgi:hypothetical protein
MLSMQQLDASLDIRHFRDEAASDSVPVRLLDRTQQSLRTLSPALMAQDDRPREQRQHDRSLRVLQAFKTRRPDVLTKSGFMLGLGEEDSEIFPMLDDMKAHRVDIVTIGQYLQPLAAKLDVNQYSSLDRFEMFRQYGESLGFLLTLSGPYVRSSFGAAEAARVLGVTRTVSPAQLTGSV